MRKHDLTQDMIAEVAKAFDKGAKTSMVEKGFPSLETMESLLANFSLNFPALGLPGSGGLDAWIQFSGQTNSKTLPSLQISCSPRGMALIHLCLV